MAGSPKFRIDVIFNTLRELQQEKELLQHQLNEAKARSKSLEAKLEIACIKNHQSNERNMRMFETVNVAKGKVTQTQSQAERLKELNNEKRGRITDIHSQITEQEKRQDQEFMRFEQELSEITEKFRDAKNYYVDQNLQNEMAQWAKMSQETEDEVTSHENTVQELCQQFEILQTDQRKRKEDSQQKLEYDITHEELQSSIDTFIEMNQEAQELLDQSQKKLEEEEKKTAESSPPRHNTDGSTQVTCVESFRQESTPRQATLMPTSDSSGIHSPMKFATQQENRVAHLTTTHETSGIIHEGLRRQPAQPTVDNTANKPGQPEVIDLTSPRKMGLQGRSFFISLPFNGNN